MGYPNESRSNRVENAFYLEQEADEEITESLQSKDASRLFLYEWDDEQQKVVGRWVEQRKTEWFFLNFGTGFCQSWMIPKINKMPTLVVGILFIYIANSFWDSSIVLLYDWTIDLAKFICFSEYPFASSKGVSKQNP